MYSISGEDVKYGYGITEHIMIQSVCEYVSSGRWEDNVTGGGDIMEVKVKGERIW